MDIGIRQKKKLIAEVDVDVKCVHNCIHIKKKIALYALLLYSQAPHYD
jgi:hypothetical protein